VVAGAVFASTASPLFVQADAIQISATCSVGGSNSIDFPPDPVDLGDITSTGCNGRQLLVEPTDPDTSDFPYRFFPFYPLTPPSPAQSSLILREGSNLTVAIPYLQHLPTRATINVSHSLHGSEILVDAAIHLRSSATATIFGPHEYLYAIGTLPAGDYKLTLNVASSSDYGGVYPQHLTGYIHFSVLPIPEPSTWLIQFVGILILGSLSRIRLLPRLRG
jgi:hypothetical protein